MTQVSGDYMTGTWVIDPQRSAVKFSISHLIAKKVHGVFTEFDGQIVTRPDVTQTAVQASVQVRSMDTFNAKRDEGTLAKDPFDANNHPAITYTSTSIEPSGNEVRVHGSLTVRGVTRPVVLAVTQLRFERDANVRYNVRFLATGQVNRQDFGVRFPVPLDRQGVLAGNRIDIELDVTAGLLDDHDHDLVPGNRG
ncbi:YceI family protein [Rhodococcus sp. 1R11]|uniref:YceI family protein n=1 Tax=unclassified Rhodococcus (in: high G+C Gram-positive bacteria) TaxID=192944 RepID=UPI001072A783|nr:MULTISPECIES: YceI family protein [unclassified Rhodococcus (in: high G+C Gram-positive bacteria)]MDI9933620.1 YceI family protein [Rhodococcus sp. IEGM 1354]TFI42451.1 YceI family protein [Rhodococcus sp. 1R11]